MRHARRLIAAAILGLARLAVLPSAAAAVTPPFDRTVPPPALVNYQGVLRSPAGEPKNGPFNMVFHFFWSQTVGTEVLRDEHKASGTGAVIVRDGIFNVLLGSGQIVGTPVPAGDSVVTFGNLTGVFQRSWEVWVEIEVNGEILAPRQRLVSAPYALNAESNTKTLHSALHSGLSPFTDAFVVQPGELSKFDTLEITVTNSAGASGYTDCTSFDILIYPHTGGGSFVVTDYSNPPPTYEETDAPFQYLSGESIRLTQVGESLAGWRYGRQLNGGFTHGSRVKAAASDWINGGFTMTLRMAAPFSEFHSCSGFNAQWMVRKIVGDPSGR